MRIAVGGIEHETNTYATDITGPTVLEDFIVLRGDALLRHRGKRTMLGGVLHGCDQGGHEVVPTLWANAGPSGVIGADAYHQLKTELVERLAASGPYDAVGLTLHGAGVVDGIDDLEGDLAAAVRAVVGDVPIASPLDLHGNITPAMAEVLDAMFGVHEYPHTDSFERGVEAVDALEQIAAGSWHPTTFVQPVPIMLPTSTTDPGFPAADMRDRCLAAEAEAGVLDATFFHGFPYTDVPASGCSIVVTTNGDAARAAEVAKGLAAQLWADRHRFVGESVAPATAVDLAQRIVEERGGPVAINETSDNPGGGTPGDGTHLLRALLDASPDGACFGFLFDPEAAAVAHAAGTGSEIEVTLGVGVLVAAIGQRLDVVGRDDRLAVQVAVAAPQLDLDRPRRRNRVGDRG
ncbi:MAG: M81 family metallopeptidase, partial [Actinomycetota bacterium]